VYQSPFKKIRLGKNEDGGYVAVDHPSDSYDLFLSAGVGGDITFEIDFCKKHPNVKCFLFDGTVENLPNGQRNFPNIHFVKKNIGPVETSNETNLHSYFSNHSNIFLKMDIEGGEYPWLDSLSEDQLGKFSQIVIEFHDPNCEQHERVLNVLNRTHYLVHFHGNNSVDSKIHKYVSIPIVFECTYLNKKYFSGVPGLNREPLPSKLDFPNHTDTAEIHLNYKPFVHNPKIKTNNF
jgi:hypothetical protein